MAFNSSVVLSSLTTYIDQLSFDQILTEIVLQGRSTKVFNVLRGIKLSRTINVSTSNLIITDASCGFPSPTGSFTPAQATLTVAPLMVTETVCLNGANSLEQYWTSFRMPEGSYYSQLTPEIFTKAYVSDKYNRIQNSNEILIWQGSTTGATFSVTSPDPNVGKANGILQYLTQTSASMSVVNYGGTYSGAVTRTNGYDLVNSIVDQITTSIPNILDQDDLVICMSYANFVSYLGSLLDRNNFHFGADEDGDWKIRIPGTRIHVMAFSGLKGSNYILATYASNIWIGTDGEDDMDKFTMTFESLINAVLFRALWKIGVVVGYPQYCVLYRG